MAFKLFQEFPTASLNITKLSKTAAQYTSIPHSAQLSTPPFHIPRSSDRAAVGLPTAFHSLPSLRLLRGLSCSMCEPTVISLSFESFHHQLQYPLSLHQINTALLSFLVAALQSTALDSPIFFCIGGMFCRFLDIFHFHFHFRPFITSVAVISSGSKECAEWRFVY